MRTGIRPATVFWTLLIVLALWHWINAQIDPGISEGEALGAAVTIAIALISVAILIYKQVQIRRPFKMVFSSHAPGGAEQKIFQSRHDALVGDHEIYLRIDTKIGTKISLLNIRFVNKIPLLSPTDVDVDTMKILSASVYGWDAQAERESDFNGPNTPYKCQDTVGGIDISVRKAKDWFIGDPLWLTIKVSAANPWKGYLSFRSNTDRRTTVRRRVSFRREW